MQSEDDEDSKNSWNNLKSINTFDRDSSKKTTFGSTQIIGGSLIETVTSKATTPVSLLVESLVQQLCTMLDSDPVRSKRLYTVICQQLHQMNLIDSTYEMGEFELMRSQYQRALYQLVSIAQAQDLPASLQSVWPLKAPVGMDWSRYYREFDELSFIAGGGFGKVYRVRHKLDDRHYAIKKIAIRATDIHRVMSHLTEVKTLAALHHVNVVPYKAAWLEPLLAEPNDARRLEGGAAAAGATGAGTTATETMDESQQSANSQTNESHSIDDRSFNEETSDFIQFEHSHSTSKIQLEAMHKYSIRKQMKSNTDFPRLHLKWATLYIQMALCQLTLRDWLDNRNKAASFDEFYETFFTANAERSLSRQQSIERKFNHQLSSTPSDTSSHHSIVANILNQLFSGLEYIHTKGIIHHDIKPSNIFIGCEDGHRVLVQLGDFGLACPLQDEHTEVIVGTPTYAAPEQLNGICNPKSDIYSIGIVLIELLIGFHTNMERIRTIEDARKGSFTKDIPSIFLPLSKGMLHFHHKKRLDIVQSIEMLSRLEQLLHQNSNLNAFDLLNKESDSTQLTEMQLKNEEIRQKNIQIEMLQTQIQTQSSEIVSKDHEINRLRSLLSSMKTVSEHK